MNHNIEQREIDAMKAAIRLIIRQAGLAALIPVAIALEEIAGEIRSRAQQEATRGRI